MSYRSNQGSTQISQVLSDASLADLEIVSVVAWKEVHNHSYGSSCECPVIEALCKLYELGYRLVKGKP